MNRQRPFSLLKFPEPPKPPEPPNPSPEWDAQRDTIIECAGILRAEAPGCLRFLASIAGKLVDKSRAKRARR